ncbi:MAG: hypothetical protein MSIBF_03775 [Candidatus Altiarchaeales archaeon IMC4]|nr:MAG: hypothetical protein MSIBF_03775 [Candidatus Altiarchaeales archaeon IMC4]
MMLSSYIIQDILSAFEKDEKTLRETIEKFERRYPNDFDFVGVCAKFNDYLASGDKKKLLEVKRGLEDLRTLRNMSCGGGSALPFKDRRNTK